jgi:hypothetical protein
VPERVLRRRALSPAALDELTDALLASPLMGQSTLAGSFRGSRGFALTFTRAGLGRVQARFRELSPFLDLALGEPRALVPLFGRARPTNAFYVNLLVLPGGASVGRHTDATLRAQSGEQDAVPRRVSVLYLKVPERGEGGELRLYRGDRPVARVRPEPGLLLHFRGDLQHEVTPVEPGRGGSGGRVSLVCEQYALGPGALARLPELLVQSRAGFDAYLADHAGREPST